MDAMERGARSAPDRATGDDTEPGAGDGYTVHEVNHTVEFKALNEAVDVDVPAAVVDWLETTAAATTREVTA